MPLVFRYRDCQLPLQEVAHQVGDFLAVCFKGKVARVNQVELKVLEIPLVRLGTGSRESARIRPAPTAQAYSP